MNSVVFGARGRVCAGCVCNVLNSTTSWIRCAVGRRVIADTHGVRVVVRPWGTSAANASFTLVPSIRAIVPSNGSVLGGGVLLIHGEGFASFGPHNQVTVGGVPCIPRTLKNLECRRDAVSMGFACSRLYAKAHEELRERQFAEWFDFSNETRIECTLARRGAAAQPLSNGPSTLSRLGLCAPHS